MKLQINVSCLKKQHEAQLYSSNNQLFNKEWGSLMKRTPKNGGYTMVNLFLFFIKKET